jgi:electron transfer flavoprotein beta subunit
MRVLVSFKRVPDYGSSAPIERLEQGRWVINPFDEIAVEEAVRMKERGGADEVIGVTIGPAAAEEQVRAALAMGLDRAIRVDDDRALDPYAVARILVAVVRRENPDLVLMGKQAVDDDANQVGQMLAGLLIWPQATFASKVDFLPGGRQLKCTRETDQGMETVTVELPAVVTADLRLNEPRYVSLPGLIRARRRPIEVLTCAQLGAAVEPRTRVVAVRPAAQRRAGTRVESVEDLVSRLREEEKVL